jgi:beta-phosphoglucomutase
VAGRETLAAPFTVNTMPDHTLAAFADHGRAGALPVSMEYTLVTEPDAAQLAVKAAGFMADRIRSAIAANGTFPCAVSGGQTPWLMLTELAKHDLPRVQARRSVIFADPPAVHGSRTFQGAIFDVDGVLVDSPHYRASRDALQELMDTEWTGLRGQTSYCPERFTEVLYQQVIADRPGLAGVLAALEYFGVPDADRRAPLYAAVKQEQLVTLIEAGEFMAFADAIRFVLAVKAVGIPIAAASSSRNADLLLRQVSLDTYVAERGLTLLDLLDADVSGRDLPRGKPDPMIFLVAAEELPATPARCFVVEDAAVGVQAAKAGGMAALGVARLGDEQAPADAGTDLVVRTRDEVSRPALAEGRLARKTEG